MTNDFNADLIRNLRELYRTDAVARGLFDWLAARQRDSSESSLDTFSQRLGISRGESVALARKLEGIGCGTFTVGRRGSKSRFIWAYSCISLGQAAAGESDDIEPAIDAVSDDDESSTGAELADRLTNLPARFTIAEAKRLLAASLGVEQSNIEITIKA